MESNKKTVLYILDHSLGGAFDNLHRAKRAFGGLSEEQLDSPYGDSGQTCREVLRGYEDEHDKVYRATEWFKYITKWTD